MKYLLKAINPIARRLGGYTAYTLSEREYVGTVENDSDLQTVLRSRGYGDAPRVLGIRLQATKLHPESGDVHDWALRKVSPVDESMQYHIHGWQSSAGTEIFSHYEYRPDLAALSGESQSERESRLRTHYRPTWGTDYIRGKRDETVSALCKAKD
jgi:hypothetical protein